MNGGFSHEENACVALALSLMPGCCAICAEGMGVRGIGGTDGDEAVQAINSEKNFVIEPMYPKRYAFGCTLPNAVVSSKKPLRMEITIDGNEITYNIRR